MPVSKFDKEADDKVKASVQPLFDMDGKMVVMPETFRRRVAAQMKNSKMVEARYGKGGAKK